MGVLLKRLGILVVATALLAACGNGGSAVQTRERHSENAAAPEPQGAISVPLDSAVAPAQAVVAPKNAATVLTGNRRETADAKAIRLFERNGRDFGADSAEDYLEKAKAFTSSPPADAEKIMRPNGDTLIYQARTNTFAVVDRRGVVRTMFKPSNGAAYWQDQKTSAPSFGR